MTRPDDAVRITHAFEYDPERASQALIWLLERSARAQYPPDDQAAAQPPTQADEAREPDDI